MSPESPESSSPPYWALSARLGTDAPETVEAVTNFLWEAGAVGVVEETAPAGVDLRAFFPPAARPPELEARVRAYLGELTALALASGPTAVTVEPLRDGAWAEAWRAHFRPIPVGTRLLICPPWAIPEDEAHPGRLRVVIEPGRAFGTGSHGSTQTCLELLERSLHAGPPPAALDVGCGSGILAIAAAQLGVGRVEALDVDPDAVAATEENARRNGIADRVRATLGAVEDWKGPPAPLVLANLLAPAHCRLASRLAALARPAGVLVAGGLLVHEVPVVSGALSAAGFVLVEVAEREGWAALALRRGVS